MKPALTPEEWERQGCDGLFTDGEGSVYCGYHDDVPIDRHGAAALCLHDQPFGFTHEMLDAILKLVKDGYAGVDHERTWPHVALALGAAARIEALMPPEQR